MKSKNITLDRDTKAQYIRRDKDGDVYRLLDGPRRGLFVKLQTSMMPKGTRLTFLREEGDENVYRVEEGVMRGQEIKIAKHLPERATAQEDP